MPLPFRGAGKLCAVDFAAGPTPGVLLDEGSLLKRDLWQEALEEYHAHVDRDGREVKRGRNVLQNILYSDKQNK